MSIVLISVANTLYTPSYVSFDYALSYYGMIPERVNEITSATSKNEKLFDTHGVQDQKGEIGMIWCGI